jgi:hypothetical protein
MSTKDDVLSSRFNSGLNLEKRPFARKKMP